MFRRRRKKADRLALVAAEAIRETEAFLTEYLAHPDRARRIPVVRVGYGRFPPGLAEEFWRDQLDLEAA